MKYSIESDEVVSALLHAGQLRLAWNSTKYSTHPDMAAEQRKVAIVQINQYVLSDDPAAYYLTTEALNDDGEPQTFYMVEDCTKSGTTGLLTQVNRNGISIPADDRVDAETQVLRLLRTWAMKSKRRN